ncbi:MULTISPECIES: SDR family NAD(P)-dependent oxidoreductase [Roseobacter]|uniref:Protein FixR n=1 Tax=Roseobacter litoralis (strain ATCC 49566 / DSM 6996 / JCM 21268 / NBRC 15278 / OCh 149) TaxID=391595 RepID=F7Z9Y3_ROSLO|nr:MULTISPECIES: SDR family oxidoreductase [Roseobacter]AEI94136.1 protein FixR [Roseobacter litoralis Och 149]GIT89487.1 oxidoreductase [Roseobacter sp. OBYS 0001]
MNSFEPTAKPIVAVTGASRGIGHAIVKKFYDDGWDVLTLARTPFSQVCPWAEGIVHHIETDLSEEASVRAAAMNLRERLAGRGLDALVNNAGISPKDDTGGRLLATQTEIEVFRKVEMVNLIAPLILVRELLDPLMQAGGAVVNVSSIAATQVHPFAGAAYAISKAGLSALTRELAHELAAKGVRVNAVSPGEIETSILSPGTSEVVSRDVPMKRLGHPGEVADVVAFLCSKKSSYVNGAEIPINGGQHLA